jgi:hypothetical protein
LNRLRRADPFRSLTTNPAHLLLQLDHGSPGFNARS